MLNVNVWLAVVVIIDCSHCTLCLFRPPPTVTSCCCVDMHCHSNVSASSPLVSVGKPCVMSSQPGNPTDDSHHN